MERVHQVCTYLRKYEYTMNDNADGPKRCQECPAKERVGVRGRLGTKMCRLIAQEMLNVAETGNPCRKAQDWPPPVKGDGQK